jgi:hypothetical protein
MVKLQLQNLECTKFFSIIQISYSSVEKGLKSTHTSTFHKQFNKSKILKKSHIHQQIMNTSKIPCTDNTPTAYYLQDSIVFMSQMLQDM